ncbi:hypothetical protein, partial [Serratia marcescens]|uniref:hypothetical protein n=1 Tax=Serratia marcescens TaxID=615 RepID=UPI002812E220
MLAETGLPQMMWAEAVSTACYTQNRSLIHKRFDLTPYELYYGRKPSVKYFRVFGSDCYIHNNDKRRLTAFDAKSDIGMMVGYSLVSKAYRVYNIKTHTVEESLHVEFDESPVIPEIAKYNKIIKQVERMNITNEEEKDDLFDLLISQEFP